MRSSLASSTFRGKPASTADLSTRLAIPGPGQCVCQRPGSERSTRSTSSSGTSEAFTATAKPGPRILGLPTPHMPPGWSRPPSPASTPSRRSLLRMTCITSVHNRPYTRPCPCPARVSDRQPRIERCTSHTCRRSGMDGWGMPWAPLSQATGTRQRAPSHAANFASS